MRRRFIFSAIGATVVLAAGWKLAMAGRDKLKPASPEVRHSSRSQTGRISQIPLCSRVSRYFDPPSLERWIASGNITREQADRLRELLDAGDFDGAIRYGYSLPDTSLSRPTAVYYAWFCRAASDRDEALRSWKEKSESRLDFALDGLMLGFAFSDQPGKAEWLKQARADADADLTAALHDQKRVSFVDPVVETDRKLSNGLLNNLGSTWLICGEMSAKDFTAMAWRRFGDETGSAANAWSAMTASLVEEGKLPRTVALDTLEKLRAAVAAQVATEDPEVAETKGFDRVFGAATGRIAGAVDSVADYHAPEEEPAHHVFLASIGSQLADEDPDKVAKLAISNPQDGGTVWDAYLLKLASRGRDFTEIVTRLSNPDLPPELIEGAIAAVTGPDSDEDPRLKGEIGWKIDRLPPSDLKKRLLLRLAARLQQEDEGEAAQRWLDKAAEMKTQE